MPLNFSVASGRVNVAISGVSLLTFVTIHLSASFGTTHVAWSEAPWLPLGGRAELRNSAGWRPQSGATVSVPLPVPVPDKTKMYDFLSEAKENKTPTVNTLAMAVVATSAPSGPSELAAMWNPPLVALIMAIMIIVPALSAFKLAPVALPSSAASQTST